MTVESAMYCAKYTLKSGVVDDPPIVLMSRRPGIGLPYIRMLGSWYAAQHDDVATLPRSLRIGGHLLPLDRNAYAAFEDAYLRAGGAIGPGRSVIRDHLEAVACELMHVGENTALSEAHYRKALIDGSAKAQK